MLYDLHNPTRATRIIYDLKGKEIRVNPGETKIGVDIPLELAQAFFRSKNDLTIHEYRSNAAVPSAREGAVIIDGMWGIGDNIHQRAIMRELMKKEDVWLSTCHWHIYHDLVEKGLNLIFKSTSLRAQAKTIQREKGIFKPEASPPLAARQIKLWYRKDQIDKYGSILQAMAGTCGVDHLQPLDFSLPVPDDWSKTLPTIDTGGKPLLVYRPVVLRREWNSANRNPEPTAYRTIFDAIRQDYYVVSVADLQPGEEWIVGDEAPADLKLHKGELSFEAIAALFKRADLAYVNAGFGPVLAQAVGTPCVVVYGGRESYRTTQRAGAHLAPTLGIDPIRPCDCHTEKHNCGDKKIDIPAAIERARTFVAEHGVKPRPLTPDAVRLPAAKEMRTSDTLIFATTYVDNKDRQHLTEMWLTLTAKLNPEADLLIVDSASPMPVVSDEYRQNSPKFELFDFGNNVGHLSRGGRDGWGRAFCRGLEIAIERGYTWVAHIEGDSLLRLPVGPIFDQMKRLRQNATSVPVMGMKAEIKQWVETGLMFFSVDYLRKSKFIEHYNWPVREERPTPEKVIFHMLFGHLFMLPLKALRSDKKQITHDTVLGMNLDWITHCHDDIWAFDRFFAEAMKGGGSNTNDGRPAEQPEITVPPTAVLKLNLGCGTNRMAGWDNRDIDVDITKPLPWANGSADYIFIEHCVEHVGYKQAIGFFEEALRVLRPGGVLRVVVPSIEQIMNCENPAYYEFTKKWGGEATKRGAAKAILFSHGHEMAWTASLMDSLLRYAGFAGVVQCKVGDSAHVALRGVEGHGKVIGEAFNEIESLVFEGTKPTCNCGGEKRRAASVGAPVAVILGGGQGVLNELEQAQTLIEACGAKPTYLAVNDMIPRFAGPCIAVTLHPQQIEAWIKERQAAGYPDPTKVWSHHKGKSGLVTDVTDDWRGSSGFFAIKVARMLGFERIILCGVPMEEKAQHFIRKKVWTACLSFRVAWHARQKEIEPYVRSMSGWTAEKLGTPDAAFLSIKESIAA